MPVSAEKRILNELKYMESNTDPSMKLDLVGNSMDRLTGQIVGPAGTPYEGGTYELSFEIPSNYPFVPPKVKFITKIWHPNISSATGCICLDILTDYWAAGISLWQVMISLQALMSSPGLFEPHEPLDADVASQYKINKEDFEKTAQYWAYKYAGAEPSTSRTVSCEDSVQKMIQMGFSEEKSVKSLSKNSWSLDHAINDLV